MFLGDGSHKIDQTSEPSSPPSFPIYHYTTTILYDYCKQINCPPAKWEWRRGRLGHTPMLTFGTEVQLNELIFLAGKCVLVKVVER